MYPHRSHSSIHLPTFHRRPDYDTTTSLPQLPPPPAQAQPYFDGDVASDSDSDLSSWEQPTGMFSRRARSLARRRQQEEEAAFPPPPSSRAPSVPPASDSPASSSFIPPPSPASSSDNEDNRPSSSAALFAPSLTPSQSSSFSRRSLKAQQRQQAQQHKQQHHQNMRAEMEIAKGVWGVLKAEKGERKKERGRNGSRSGRERTMTGAEEASEASIQQDEEHGLGGLAHQLEERLTTSRPASTAGGNGTSALLKRGLEAVGGTAGLLALAGTGIEWWKHEQAAKKRASSPSRQASHPAILPAPLPLPHAFPLPSSLPSPSDSRHPLSTSLPPTPTTRFISSLTPTEHHLLRHASLALLVRDRTRGVLQREVESTLREVEEGWERVEEWGKARGGRPEKLFATPLKPLTTHEGVFSSHGISPSHPIRVPEFLDHLVTALKQADATAEHLLTQPERGELATVLQIIEALDASGKGGKGNMVVDLGALDPLTLTSLLKHFLASLPDPVLTSHLFELFIAASHIHHPHLRLRAMHLTLCLMPKVNRNVLEVVLLLLSWLSTRAHVDVEVGKEAQLSKIAVEMAPLLLHPHHRPSSPVQAPSVVAVVLELLEGEGVLHEVPYDLAHILHLEAQEQVPEKVLKKGGKNGLVEWFGRLL